MSPFWILEALFPVLIFVVSVLVFVHGLRGLWGNFLDTTQESEDGSKEFCNPGVLNQDGEDVDVLRRPDRDSYCNVEKKTHKRKLTKERMNGYPKGKEKLKKSVHNDLENLVENLRFGESTCWKGTIFSYFLPQLTVEDKKNSLNKKTQVSCKVSIGNLFHEKSNCSG